DEGKGDLLIENPDFDPSKPIDNTNKPLIPGTPGQPVDPANPDGPKVPERDDDRAIGVDSITVNEGSSHGVFTVTGSKGQKVTLELADGTATGGGVDFGSTGSDNLQYSQDGGQTWHDYVPGTSVEITGADGKLLVRTPIVNDDLTEISEDFTLEVKVLGGKATAIGTGTIRDDGTGEIWVPEDREDPSSPLKPNPDPGQPDYVVPDVDNRDPSAPPTSVTTPEDTPVSGRVPGTDPDGDALTYTEKTPPAHGTVVVDKDGSYTYTPDKDYHGPDSFEVEVDDGKGGKTTTTVTVTVTPVNDAPQAPDYDETTPEDTPVSGKVTGTDVDGDDLTYSKGSDPRHGTVTVQPDGSYTYVPNPDFNGTDSFTVEVSDGKGGWTTSTVKVVVTPLNDAPTAPPVDVSTKEDTPVTGKVEGKDPDGDDLTYTEKTPPAKGTVVIDEKTGEFTYTPDPGTSGKDSFEVEVDDGNGGKTTVTVTVDVNGRPEAGPDHVTTPEDTPVSGKVTGTDPDGDDLTYTKGSGPAHGTVTVNEDGSYTYVPGPDYVGEDSFEVIVKDGKGNETTTTVTVTVTPVNDDPTAPNYFESTPEDTPLHGKVEGSDVDGDDLTYSKGSDPRHGMVTVQPDGSYTYVPDPDFNGTDSFEVIVDDGNGGKTTSTVTVNVTPDNDAPQAPDYERTIPEDTPLVGKVQGSDPDGDPLTYTKGSDPKHGTVTVNPDGGYIYVPEPNFHGEDSFTVTVSDGQGGTTTSTVTITVTPVNDAPTAPPVYIETNQGDPIPGKVVGDDPDGDDLTYEVVDGPSKGTVEMNKDGTFTYVPEPPYDGPDSFTVEVDDGKGGKTTTTVYVNVKPDNKAPEAPDYDETVKEDQPLVGRIEGTDPNKDPLTYTVEEGPKHGTVTLNPDGGYTYVPEPNFHGEDSFTVTVDDGKGGKTTSTVNITVTPENDDPVAPPVRVTTPEDTPISGKVTGTDVDGDDLTYTKTSEPQNGTVTVNQDGTFTYTPNKDWSGTDSFEVTVDDGNGGKVTTTVTVVVVPENDVPEADPVELKTNDNTPVTGKVTGTDPDGDPLTYSPGPNGPGHGTVTITPDGKFTYVPEPGFHGKDSFEVTVDDGKGGKITTTVTVDVNGTPKAPPVDLTTDEGVNVPGKVEGFDPDGDKLTYEVTTPPGQGAVIFVPETGDFIYVPKPGTSGTDTFEVTVDDGRGGKTTVTVTVNVRPTPAPDTGRPNVPQPPDTQRPEGPLSGGQGGLVSGDVAGMPGVFFHWDDVSRVARMDGPLHPIVFVAPTVADSQAQRERTELLGNDLGLAQAGELQATSIGAGLVLQPSNVIYVSRAVNESQDIGSFWSRVAQALQGNLPADAPQRLLNVAADAGIPASLQEADAPAAEEQDDGAEQPQADAQTLLLLQRWALDDTAHEQERQAAAQQREPVAGSFRQQLEAQARQLLSHVNG
ncbi:Uncharacterised protein, partial [uncultured Comamonas sp.]